MGWSSLFLLAFAMASCGRSNTSDANLSASSATPGPASAQATTPIPARPQVELAAAFDASKDTIFQATTGAELMKVTALRQVNLSLTANGLKVIADGTDPSLLLPAFVEGKKCILQVVINSPADTPIQVFYLTRDHPGHDETRSQLVPLKQSRNVVYFQLDQPDLIDPVRLDPGAAPGDYVIESLVARAMANSATP